MTEHYYSQNPSVEHDERRIKTTFFQKNFTFKTDAGVFSKRAVDFGTTLLIESISLKNGSKVLDLGCGYGPIGITIASKLQNGEVLLVDINERAVELAKENIQLNRNLISDQVKIEAIQSEGFSRINHEGFHYIFLNPPIRAGKTLIYQLFEESHKHLEDQGELWIVIQKKQGATSAMKKLNSLFSVVEEVDKKKGYSIIKSKK